MAVAPYTGSGSVPVRETHPVLDGGSLIGHGGAALKVFVGLSVQQNQQLEHMGQLEAPRGRRGEFYWPLSLKQRRRWNPGPTERADLAGCRMWCCDH